MSYITLCCIMWSCAFLLGLAAPACSGLLSSALWCSAIDTQGEESFKPDENSDEGEEITKRRKKVEKQRIKRRPMR